MIEKAGIDYKLVSRNPVSGSEKHFSYTQITSSVVDSYTLIINTTPVGMYPNLDECPSLPYSSISPKHYLFDLIYNPEKTLFLQKRREERGAIIQNGSDMLVLQAEESWKIWNDLR